MVQNLFIYNTLTRKKEAFKPLAAPYVGMYVCGPTVYNDIHLGNCRTFVTFDLIFRYLKHLGYKVRYVRNITDAGHLEEDTDVDKISKKAILDKLEPMELVQKYTVRFHKVMQLLNVLEPSIEPTATGHMIEQIEVIKRILHADYAYEVDGTIYFDVVKYNKQQGNYGILSGRNVEALRSNTRSLAGQGQKRGPLDFALWIKAKPEYLMQWPAPWSVGFPGWHLECSTMSYKYLGEQFDIHGGGMDLIPTHHTNEIAQSMICFGKVPAVYWMHANMLTVNGKKMSKSLGNSLLPEDLFKGQHTLSHKAYTPMTLRFLMMQAHYRSVLDFSKDALDAAERGLGKLLRGWNLLAALQASEENEVSVAALQQRCYDAMNDDFNSPVLIAELFGACKIIHAISNASVKVNQDNLDLLKKLMNHFVVDILGLKDEMLVMGDVAQMLQLVIDLRKQARLKQDYATADSIRDALQAIGFQLKDGQRETTWEKFSK